MKNTSNVVALVGMTGCGKTSVGKFLAKKTGAHVIDLDDEIVRRYGAVKDIFDKSGEEGFRKIEFDVLSAVINENDADMSAPLILSCGGGAPTYKPSYELLRDNTIVVWLRRNADSISSDSAILKRPPLNGSIENYKRLMGARYPTYRSLADYSFFNSFPQRTAAAIAKKLYGKPPKHNSAK